MALATYRQGFAHLALVVVLAVALAGSLGFIFWQNVIKKTPAATDTSTSTQTTNTNTTGSGSSATTKEEVKNGTISGRAIYPSEGYPENFTVCATSGGVDVACDNSMAKTVDGIHTYSLSVAPGDYQVVARGYTMKGYYDGYMKSGQTADLCKSENHTPLTVTVTAGAVITGIDAGDFYYMPENC